MNKAIKFVCALGFGAVACFGGYFTAVYTGADCSVRVEDLNGFVSPHSETATEPLPDFGTDISNPVIVSNSEDTEQITENISLNTDTELPVQSEENDSEELVDDSGDTEDIDTSGLVNINSADTAALETLPGIGPALAERIIEYRENNGFFVTLEELKAVRGIGNGKYDKISSLVCI